MKVVKFQEAIEYPAPPPSRKASRILIDDTAGATKVALGVATYQVGEKGNYHTHSNHEETMYILEGKAKMETEKSQFIVEKDTAVHVPIGEKHRMENAGEGILRFIWIYTPPGEERSIKERARKPT